MWDTACQAWSSPRRHSSPQPHSSPCPISGGQSFGTLTQVAKDISSFPRSLLPSDVSPSCCPGAVGSRPAGHGPPSLFPSQGFLHADLRTRLILHLAKPAGSLGAGWVGAWVQHARGTSIYSAAKPTTKTSLTHPAHPAILPGCRDGTIHRSPLTVTGECNSSRNYSQPNPTSGNTIKTRPQYPPCSQHSPLRPPVFPALAVR